MTIAAKFALLCDDIRQENNGKFILIGVYSTDVGLTKTPATLALSLLIGFEATEKESETISIAAFLNDRLTKKVRGRLTVEGPGIYHVPLSNIVFNDIAGDSTIEFRWSKGDDITKTEEWETFFSIPIRVRPRPK